MDDTKGTTLNQTYDINNIKLVKEKYEDEKMIGRFFQIRGLKDKDIEDSINRKLKNALILYGEKSYKDTKEYYDEKLAGKEPEWRYTFTRYIDGQRIIDTDKRENWKIKVDQAVLSNYSNVLSIMCSQVGYFSVFGAPKHDYINLNLITGEDLKIEEIFTKDIFCYDIYKNSIYNRLAEGNVIYDQYDTWKDENGVEHQYGWGSGTYESVDTKLQEQLVNKFKYTKDISFGFSDNYVIFEFDNIISTFSFADHPEYIAIFNRFAGKDIYDGKYNKSKGIPAYYNSSTGKIISSKSFVQDGNVILNYYIKSEYDFETDDKYASLLFYANDIIENQVKLDTNRINEQYSGDNLILYSANFNIQLCDVEITQPEYSAYKQFIKEGTQYFYWNYEPKVYEITKDDLKVLMSDYTDRFYWQDLTEFRTTKVYEEGDEYHEEKLYSLKLYLPFYREIRQGVFQLYNYSPDDYGFRSLYSDYTVVTEKGPTTTKTRTIPESDLIDYVVKDHVALAEYYYDTHPSIWPLKDLRRDNFQVILENDHVKIKFPYYHTGVESWENYSTAEWFNILINKISYGSDKDVYISEFYYW